MTRRRDDGTARRRDDGTTGLRDGETTGHLKNTGVLRRSQAFPAVRGSAGLCEAVRGAWRQSGAAVSPIKRLGWMDSTERTFHSAQ
ncbi:MAG: hypothetical protein II986_06395 [Alistipes sp.]|nr:hypothetical protein [Alistipes sp.]